jgi:hypothetical protein
MARKRSDDTDTRDFDRGPNVQPGRPPGSPPPDPGRLDHRRQSGTSPEPPEGEEKFRPKNTGRTGA